LRLSGKVAGRRFNHFPLEIALQLKLHATLACLLLVLVVAGCRARHTQASAAVPPRPAGPADLAPAGAAPVTGITVTAHGLLLHAAAATNRTPPFICRDDPASAGGLCVEVPPGAGYAEGSFSLSCDVDQAGPYTLWLRAFWGSDGEDACSNSIYVQLDSQPRILVQDATYRAWHWVRARFPGAREGWVQIAAGTHRLQFASREDGIKIDQIYLVPWHPNEMECYVPQEIEK